jgi:ABC-type uncharacterized transport system substrate-binding protein
VAVTDPVGAGLVASVSRPGGNITGFSNTEETFGGKLLSLLKTIAPRITRAAVMFNPDTAPGRGLYHLGSFEAAARALAIEPITARVHSDDDIEAAITSLGREQGGLVATPDTFINNHRGTMIAVSLRNGVPAIFDGTGFARQGGLLQYGPDFRDMYRGAASYVDRILRGAKPSDLPVELPTKYALVIKCRAVAPHVQHCCAPQNRRHCCSASYGNIGARATTEPEPPSSGRRIWQPVSHLSSHQCPNFADCEASVAHLCISARYFGTIHA